MYKIQLDKQFNFSSASVRDTVYSHLRWLARGMGQMAQSCFYYSDTTEAGTGGNFLILLTGLVLLKIEKQVRQY